MTRQQRLVLVVSILASFVAFLDGSVVGVALPTISRQLGGGLIAQQWIVDGYMLTLGSLILLAGSLSDLFGRQKILITGLIGFALTSVLCAAAPSSSILIVARLLQGIAGALLVPSSLAMIIGAFSGAAQGKAIGSWTAWTGIAFIIGPLLGGILVDSVSWRGIFAINIVPIAVTLWLLRRIEHTDKPREHIKIDAVGALLCTLGLGLPVLALIEQPQYGWHDPLIWASFLGGLALFAVFVWWELRQPQAMLPLDIFRSRNFSVGNAATALIYGALAVATFLISIYVQQVLGYSALRAGLALLPTTVVMFVLSPRFGALAGRFGPRLFMTLGPLLGAGGFLLMTKLHPGGSYWTHLFPGVLLFSLGLACTVSPLTSAVLGGVDKQQAGVGSAVNNAISRVAGLIAVAAIGLVTGTRLDTAGFHRALIIAAILMAAGSVISAAGIRRTQLPVALRSR